MRADDILSRVGDGLGVRRVFGEPVERDGTTVIPVSMIMGGGGGGGAAGGDPGTPGGAGYGGWSRGIGVYTIREGQVRFVPAVDRTFIAVVAILAASRLFVRLVTSTAKAKARART